MELNCARNAEINKHIYILRTALSGKYTFLYINTQYKTVTNWIKINKDVPRYFRTPNDPRKAIMQNRKASILFFFHRINVSISNHPGIILHLILNIPLF